MLDVVSGVRISHQFVEAMRWKALLQRGLKVFKL